MNKEARIKYGIWATLRNFTCSRPYLSVGVRGREYLSWAQAGSWLSQLSLVLVQSLFGSLILRVEEQDAKDIFHRLRHIPHWRRRKGRKWGRNK